MHQPARVKLHFGPRPKPRYLRGRLAVDAQVGRVAKVSILADADLDLAMTAC
ncbi:MAG: hypothetical protein K8R36_02625 [Planctomycetales bacterium]|nr:hypothetical protein [Planctomycetales bacterium]